MQFTIHSDLGRVVQAIIREFSKNPPQLTDDISLTNKSRGNLIYYFNKLCVNFLLNQRFVHEGLKSRL